MSGAQGILTTGTPGAEQRGQPHLGLRALRRACAAADLATGHQMAQTALRGIVVRWYPRLGHKDEQLGQTSTRSRLIGGTYRDK